jgi:hypothetical protein
MTKNSGIKNCNNSGKNNRKTQDPNSMNLQSNAILKIELATQNNHKVKVMFTDNEGKEMKELIDTYNDNNTKKHLIDIEKQLLKLGGCYKLFSNGMWKYLCRLKRCVLDGCCVEYWQKIPKKATDHRTGNSATQQSKFIKLI